MSAIIGSSEVMKLAQDTAAADAKESTTIRFEWTLRGLKNLFENSKGEAKSKVTKSPRFGDGRWQILFYANSGNVGSDGQTFVSLYLACEPTTAEKENAVNGKWSREGLFNFGFEIRNITKAMQFNVKEAHDHSFYYPGAQNWGWAQFARRDAVYYQPATVKQHDAFVIICTITSSPATPASMPAIPRYRVPQDLLDSMGSLLDDPLYSDVEFVLPQRGKSVPRKIYAARRLLSRVAYFDAMFGSGFAESASNVDLRPDPLPSDDASVSETGAIAQYFDDTDLEDDDNYSVMLDNDHDSLIDDPYPQDVVSGTQLGSEDVLPTPITQSATTSLPSESNKRILISGDEANETRDVLGPDASDEHEQSARNTRPKLSHPSTPWSRDVMLEQEAQMRSPPPRAVEILPVQSQPQPDVPGPKKARVVVKDVAYTTYRAVLYYIYTDMITFAPLSSTFLGPSSLPLGTGPHATSVVSTPAALSSENQLSYVFARANQPSEASGVTGSLAAASRSRKEWLAEWERNNPSRPRPASAKSVYRLADKLELQDLKERAFHHIVKSLTVENVAHEAFSAFSAAFEDIRKVEVKYMFDHWLEVRKGPLLNIGQQLRLGRFPGFEEVWPTIIQNLVADDKKSESESSSR
ncbi:hypothetical protein BD311DRAFT_763462 [Dichomitus squalens]|uniref:MATH domain-containing protein n=1 Tax=Dichomitus squalens TaxID=114155 RepID=A0A4Q9MHD4_9APHY|nr:hypothetical protein BD311DRAFT_763462 [Dichomitus squalens]